MKSPKHIAFLFVALSFSYSLYANPIKEVLDKLSDLNNEEKVDCTKMSNDEVASLCVEEVCGDSKKNPVILTKDTVALYNSAEAIKKMDDAEASIRRRKEEIEEYVKFVTEEQKKLKALKNPDLIKDQEAQDIIKTIIGDIDREHNILQSIMPARVKNDKIKLTLPKKSPYYQVYQDVISHINVKENLEYAIELNIAPDYETQYQIYLEKAQKFQQELKERNLTTKYDFETSKASLEQSKNKNYVGDFYSRMLKDAKAQGISLERPVCDKTCKEHLITHFQKVPLFDPAKIVAEEQKKFDFEDAIAECRATIAFNNIKARDSQEIEKEWPKLLEKLKNNSSLKFSDHSKALILERINKDIQVLFNVPPMNNHVNPLANSLGSLKPYETGLSDSYELATNKSVYGLLTKTPRCNKVEKAVSINDMVMFDPTQNKGVLVVSPFSCEHVHIGKEVMAHELGHAVSYIIGFTPEMSSETRANFKTMRECSRQEKRTTKFPALVSTHEGDKWTTEEDTADLFSYALSEDKENFFGCALVIPSGEDYQGLRLRKSFFDTHSSGIQRLMVELQYKNPGKITEACGEVIKRSKARITNKCI